MKAIRISWAGCRIAMGMAVSLLMAGSVFGGSIFDDDWTPPPLAKPAPPKANLPPPPSSSTDPTSANPTPPTETKPEPAATDPNATPVTVAGANLRPIPTSQELAKVRGLFKDVYSRQLADSSARGKKALAIQLIGDAAKITDAPTDRFVMLAGARRAAVDAGDVESAIAADDELCKEYAVDARESRLELLTQLSRNVHLAPSCAAIVAAAFNQSDHAEAESQYALAQQFDEVAVVAAKGSDNAALRNESTTREANMRAVASAYAQLDKSIAVLRKTPADAEANLAVGRFYCLMVGQWNVGLKFLAAGSDAKMSAAAREDIQGGDALAIGDAWRALAEKESSLEKHNLKLRAAKWYGDASSNATGLAKLKAEHELAELNLGPIAPSQPAAIEDPDAPQRPKSARAIAAIAKYDTALESSRIELDRAMTAAHKQLDAEFEVASRQAVRAQNTEEAARIDAWKKLLEAKYGPPPGVLDLKAQIIEQHIFVYKYGGYGPRDMEFLPEGRIGNGWGSLEKKWEVVERAHGPVIVLSGDAGPAEFSRKDDGTFMGKWPDGNTATLRPGSEKADSGTKPADAKSAERPKSPAAVAALKNFESARDKARANRAKVMAAPLKQLISELTFSEKDATRIPDLAEAKRIDDWKKYVQSKAVAGE